MNIKFLMSLAVLYTAFWLIPKAIVYTIFYLIYKAVIIMKKIGELINDFFGKDAPFPEPKTRTGAAGNLANLITLLQSLEQDGFIDTLTPFSSTGDAQKAVLGLTFRRDGVEYKITELAPTAFAMEYTDGKGRLRKKENMDYDDIEAKLLQILNV